MATITAADVNKLRQQTGLGMMDCKNALVEANGDFQVAIEILRKKGQKVAEKRGDRDAAEGYVIAQVNNNKTEGVVLVLNCETDFVAKNEDFVNFATKISNIALNAKAKTAEEVYALSFDNQLTVKEKITEEIGKIGEKIEVSEYAYFEGSSVIAYNHPGNKIASLVAFNQAGDKVAEAGRDVAMQIAAMAPISVDSSGVSQSVIDKELEIGKEQARQEGKPENMLDKIAEGKLKKFFKESTLLEQDFIKDNKKSVGAYLKEVDANLKVLGFKRISIAQ